VEEEEAARRGKRGLTPREKSQGGVHSGIAGEPLKSTPLEARIRIHPQKRGEEGRRQGQKSPFALGRKKFFRRAIPPFSESEPPDGRRLSAFGQVTTERRRGSPSGRIGCVE